MARHHTLAPTLALAAASLVSMAAAASAADTSKPGAPVKGQLVVFDAQERQFTTKPASLSSRKPVILLVQHVKTFQEKYELSVRTTNYFNQDMPQALKDLFVMKPEQVLPAGANLPTAGGFLEDADLVTALEEFNQAVEAFEAELKKELTIPTALKELRAPTNEAARRNLVRRVHRSYDTPGTAEATVSGLVDQDVGDLEEDNVAAFRTNAFVEAVGTVSEVIRSATELTRKHDDVEQKGKALQAKLRAFRRAHAEANIDETNQEVTDAVNKATQQFNDAKQARENIAYLYETMLNPAIVPTSIRLEESLNVDEVEFRVKVTQTTFPLFQPAAAAGQGGTGGPPAPPGTATPGAAVIQVATDNRLNERTYTHRASVYFRWVRDFSLGITSTDLYKTNYYIANVAGATPTRQGVFESSKDKDGAWAPFAHFYMTTNLPLGLSVGPTIGVMPSGKTRYLLGGSVVVMPTRRIRVYYTYGAAFGKVERLAGSTVSSETPEPLDPAQSLKRPQYEELNRWGHFHALSFSFSF